jgi:hypothetical protein
VYARLLGDEAATRQTHARVWRVPA